MVPLLGTSVLRHAINNLRSQGITEMVMTLAYLPDIIKNEFGDGSSLNMKISYYTEKTPLGTAGGVKACADFLSEGDFLVLSGDAVCDFDFNRALEFHRQKNADVTIILSKQPNPVEYGLVLTDSEGRIQNFTEKPAWEQVFTNSVNTGIYILSPEVLNYIPDNKPFDFARDLFPLLMSKNKMLYACELDGYWCDIGDIDSYLRCSFDALNGKLRLQHELCEYSHGVFLGANMTPPDGVIVNPPVYIHPSSKIMSGSVIGPDAIISEGAFIGEGCIVSNSIIEGSLAPRCEADGCIVCGGANIGNACIINRGAVIGKGVNVGDGSHISSNVRIWPDIVIPAGSSIKSNLTAGGHMRVAFDENCISGSFSAGITPELCCGLGSALVSLIKDTPRVAVGSSGGADVMSLASALASGLSAAGCNVFIHDIAFASGAAAIAKITGCALSVFIESQDDLKIYIFKKSGRFISLSEQKKLENIISRGEIKRVPSIAAGKITHLTGAVDFYASAMAEAGGQGNKLKVAVHGRHPAALALMTALSVADFTLPSQPALSFEGLTISISRDGFSFAISDSKHRFSAVETTGLVLLSAMLEQPGITIALPYDAPTVYDILAEQNGAGTVRLGRDGEYADKLYAEQLFTHDACCGAIKLLSFLSSSGTTLSSLRTMLPVFGCHSIDVELCGNKADVIRRIGESCKDMSCEYIEGIKICVDGGYVRIRPSATRQSLRITAESFSEEIAREIAIDFSERSRKFDY
jgi:mannose-1-phosphate guanylyltransferase/phosphomannomutase